MPRRLRSNVPRSRRTQSHRHRGSRVSRHWLRSCEQSGGRSLRVRCFWTRFLVAQAPSRSNTRRSRRRTASNGPPFRLGIRNFMPSAGEAAYCSQAQKLRSPTPATWLAHTSGGVNCETGWVAGADRPFCVGARFRVVTPPLTEPMRPKQPDQSVPTHSLIQGDTTCQRHSLRLPIGSSPGFQSRHTAVAQR